MVHVHSITTLDHPALQPFLTMLLQFPSFGHPAQINQIFRPYLRRHWTKFTLFLRVSGAPLDNNLVERALKKAILHRKNSLFYKTMNGAEVGDLFMSLIHTCELNGANPFDYLTELQRHAEQVKRGPAEWMPWNYRERLAPAVSGIDSG